MDEFTSFPPGTDFLITNSSNEQFALHSTTDSSKLQDSEFIPLYLAVSLPWFCSYLFVYTGIFLAAFFGNLLVITSFYVEPKLRKTTNYYFFSLAHADLLATMLGLPPAIFARLAYGSVSCLAKYRQYYFMMAFMMSSISVGHLVLITIDRFIAITWPLHYRQWVTVRRCKVGLFVIWLLGIGFGILPIIGELDNPNEWVCGSQDYDGAVVTFHRLIAVIALPAILLVLACCYLRIFFVARRWARQAALRRQTSTGSNDSDDAERKSTMRATVTTVMILGVFAICWLPSSAKFFIETYADITDESLFLIQTMAEILSFMNSAINPYLYASRNRDFRRAYEKVLSRYVTRCLCPCRTQNGRSEKSSEQEMSCSTPKKTVNA
ncbi:Adenosine receptor A2b [Holothuria leucospilota]|uniref:Adenosine receptor A2b n=1 Tax=Holothuria leucospilota TaxID=206669 RepID=A0A9Q0YTL1_HOLLE|nr:Adenosine receptor A2b [Holothuria leucospilota]